MFTDPTTSLQKLFVAAVFVAVTVAGCRSALDTPKTTKIANFDSNLVDRLGNSNTFEDGFSDLDDQLDTKVGLENNEQTNDSDVDSDHHQTIEDESDNVVHVSFDSTGQQIRTLTLMEALNLAISNSEFIVDNASFLSSANPLLDNPQFLQSKFDLDLQKSSQQSVEAALANFDTQIATGFQWGRNSVIQANSNFLSTDLLINDNGSFYGRLDKPVASGATYSVIHNLNYSDNSQTFPIDPRFNGFLRGEFRQPILAGRGRLFTDIAGPNSYRFRQYNRGVALADVAERTAEIELHLGIEKLIKQTEELYWDFWLAHRIYENRKTAAENANEIWSTIRRRAENGLTGGEAANEAQAEENFFRLKSLTDAALIDLEQAAERLKHLTGIENEPGAVLVAIDSPPDLPIVFEIESSITNGLTNRKELIKQDLQIQAIEFQLFASQQLNRPQLDLVSGVQLNGLGDDLFNSTGAFTNLVDLDDIGWNVGFEFSKSLGFRQERLNVRYLTLLLNKATTARQLQEREIRHEISFTAKTVEKWSRTLISAKRRLAAAERRLAAVDADFKSGRASLDLFLRSQDSIAEAQLELSRAKAELTKAQLDLLFRQGISKFTNG